MALETATPRPEADRLKAFELYMSAAADGKSRSLRSIAAALGVSAMTIGRWKDVDDWDGKVSKVLAEAATGAETTSNALKRRVRQGLLDGLSQLQSIAMNADHDRDKIAAIKALADIAIRLDAITAAAGQGGQAKEELKFNDNLPEVRNVDSLASGDSGGGGELLPSDVNRNEVSKDAEDLPTAEAVSANDNPVGDDGQRHSGNGGIPDGIENLDASAEEFFTQESLQDECLREQALPGDSR